MLVDVAAHTSQRALNSRLKNTVGTVRRCSSLQHGLRKFLRNPARDRYPIMQGVPVVGIVARENRIKAPVDRLCSALASNVGDARFALGFNGLVVRTPPRLCSNMNWHKGQDLDGGLRQLGKTCVEPSECREGQRATLIW